jgi:predicted acetyltransferase
MEAAYREFSAALDSEQPGLAKRWLFENTGEPFPDLVEKLQAWKVGQQLPESSWVPCSTFYLIDGDGKILGKSSFRHELNDFLRTIGGNIGYVIRQKDRRKGCGTEILRLTLEKAKQLGLHRVLVTCDEDNIASAKIIEKNGGVFENTFQQNEQAVPKRRYWISLKYGANENGDN